MKGVEQPPQYHPEGDVWIHTRMMLEGLPAGTAPTLAWGVLLHDVGKPPTFQSTAETGDRIRFNNHVEVGVRMAEAICRRLRFSNEDTDRVFPHAYTFAEGAMHPGDAPGLGVDLDEQLAAQHPYDPAYLPVNRLLDGTVHSW